MKVKVQGSSVIWRKDPNSCYLIDDHIMLDCGEGCTYAFGKDFKTTDDVIKKVDTILITHFHSDHFFGLVPFLDHYYYYAKPEEYGNLTIYGPKGLRNALTFLRNIGNGKVENVTEDVGLDKLINIVEIDFNDTKKPTFEVGGYKVSCYDLNHGELDDIGYVFDDGSYKVGFSGDCIRTDNLEELVEESGSVFLDCAGVKTSSAHLGLDDFLDFKNKYPEKTFIPIHCSTAVHNVAEENGIKISASGDEFEFGCQGNNEVPNQE